MGASSAEVIKVSVSIAKYVDRKCWCCGDCRLKIMSTTIKIAGAIASVWSNSFSIILLDRKVSKIHYVVVASDNFSLGMY